MAINTDKPVRIGDKLRFIPTGWEGKTEFSNGFVCPASVVGTVTYVHRRGLFCVVEAQVGREVIRESLALRRGVRP